MDGKQQSFTGTSCTVTLPSGTHTFVVTAWDAAGNSASKESSVKLESVVPDVPEEPVAPDAPGATLEVTKPNKKGKASVKISWDKEEGATYVLQVTGDDGYEKTINLKKKNSWKGNLYDSESYEYTLTTTYKNGAVSERYGEFDFDATAPVVKTVETVYDPEAKETSLSWERENTEYGPVTYRVLNGKEVIGTVTTDSEQVFMDFDAKLPDKKYNCVLEATDQAGNTSTKKFSFKVDTTPVDVRNIKAAVKRGKKGDGATVTLSWKGESKATYKVYVDEALVYEGTKTNVKLYDMDERNAGFTYSYRIEASDLAGNESSKEGEFVVDTVAPEFEIFYAPENKSYINSHVADIQWAYVEGETYTLKIGKETINHNDIRVENGLCTYTIEGEGYKKYSYTLIAVDEGMNKTTKKGSFTMDTIAPEFKDNSIKVKGCKVVGEELQFTLSWKCDSKATYDISDGASELYAGKKASYTFSLEEGEHHFALTATDVADNETTLDITLEVDLETKSATITEIKKIDSAALSTSLDQELGVSAGINALAGDDVLAAAGLAGDAGALLPATEAEKNQLAQLA